MFLDEIYSMEEYDEDEVNSPTDELSTTTTTTATATTSDSTKSPKVDRHGFIVSHRLHSSVSSSPSSQSNTGVF